LDIRDFKFKEEVFPNARVLFGEHTNAGYNEEPSGKIRICTTSLKSLPYLDDPQNTNEGKIHLTLEYSDPRFKMRVGRTYFLTSNYKQYVSLLEK